MTDHTTQLSLLAPRAPRRAASTTQARVLLFNTQHAAPGRAYRQAQWISEQETADLVVLTEVSSGPGGTALVEALREAGYSSVIAPVPQTPDYRTVLASRSAPLQTVDSGVAFLPHRAPAATVTVGDGPFGIVGLYVPSRGTPERRNQDKRAFQAAVTAALPGLAKVFPDMPVIVAGDLNVIEPGHQPAHAVFGKWEYAFYESFAAAGFTDAYRHQHPSKIDHSWFGRSGRGFRFDHVFSTARHAREITECTYLQAPREEGLTDHAAMNLILSTAPRAV